MIYMIQDNTFDHLAWKGIEESSIDELFNYLLDSDYRVRTLAAQKIQVSYATKQTFDDVSKMLTQESWKLREIGAYILGQLGTPNMPYEKDTLPLLYKLFDDTSKHVVATAISSVGHLWQYKEPTSDNYVINRLIKFAKHNSVNIRIASIVTLANINRKDIKSLLREINRKDPNTEVREWAELSLEILEDN